MVTIGDRTRAGSNDDLLRALKALAVRLHRASWASGDLSPRTDKSVALSRIAKSAAEAIELSTDGKALPHVIIFATSVRAVFELYARCLYVLKNDQNLRQWIEEAWIDRIELWQAIRKAPQVTPELTREFDAEVARLRQDAADKALNVDRKIPKPFEIAKEAGMDNEHQSFYKLYSKLVHASSFLVNGNRDEVNGPGIMAALQLNVQYYGHAFVGTVCDALGFDQNVVAPVDPDGAA